MKTRFSILTLLGVTAYVAVNAAAYVQPLSLWPYVALSTAAMLALYAIVVASGSTNASSVFARGALWGVVILMLVQALQPFRSLGKDGEPYFTRYRDYFAYWNLPPTSEDEIRLTQNHLVLVDQNVSLTAGIFCGSLALWRYQRQER